MSEEMADSPRDSNILPDLHLLCMEERFSDAFNEAVSSLFPELPQYTKVTIHNESLKNLDKNLAFDAVVSPANSYARLDGAFDDALAKAYGPVDDYDWITRKAQNVLYDKWRGFAPPGTCTVVRLDYDGVTVRDGKHLNPWQTEYLLLCPTMAIPDDVRWDKEVVYECIWSLLCAIDGHNRSLKAHPTSNDKAIQSILMTPLATGVGRISAKQWAEQCVLAMKFFVESVEEPQIWSRLNWQKIFTDHLQLEATNLS